LKYGVVVVVEQVIAVKTVFVTWPAVDHSAAIMEGKQYDESMGNLFLVVSIAFVLVQVATELLTRDVVVLQYAIPVREAVPRGLQVLGYVAFV
jgi:hypothetical protein